MEKKLIIAHRGNKSGVFENTLLSFKEAISEGADMVELDMRKTKDDILIANHNRIIGRKLISKIHWADIEKINKRRNLEVPRLDEILKSLKGKIKLDIEMKEAGYEEEAVMMLKNYFSTDDFVITSSNGLSVKKIKNKFPEVKVGLILGIRKPQKIITGKILKILPSNKHILENADFFVPHWISVQFGFLEKAEKYNKSSFVWTVNNKRRIEKLLIDERVRGIITDKVSLALEIRKKIAK
jgi:glycerophosphoryl diester phosphodiesterase